eukprot:2982254-Rhodomonas_salina.1
MGLYCAPRSTICWISTGHREVPYAVSARRGAMPSMLLSASCKSESNGAQPTLPSLPVNAFPLSHRLRKPGSAGPRHARTRFSYRIKVSSREHPPSASFSTSSSSFRPRSR